MRSVSLSIFSVSVRRKRSKELLLLDQFSDQADDLLDALRDVLAEFRDAEIQSRESDQALQITRMEFRDREIQGLIDAGSFGVQSVIRRLGHFDTVRYNKAPEDVDLLPYYFLFHLPEASTRGYFILQSTGTGSIQTLFRQIVGERLSKNFPDYRLVMEALVPQSFQQELERQASTASEVRFIRFDTPEDAADRLGRAAESGSGTMDLVIRFREGGARVPLLRRMLGGENPGVIAFDDGTRFSYNDIKIKMLVGGKKRTVDLGNDLKLRPSVDVTEDLDFRRGVPTFTSLARAAHELLAQFQGLE